MNRFFPRSSGRAKAGWSVAGMLAATLLLWCFTPVPVPVPATVPVDPSISAAPAELQNPAMRAEVRRELPKPSAEAAEAVEQGRFVMHISHPDEARLVRIMVHRGGLVLAEAGQQLYLLAPTTRTPVADAKVPWSEYSLQRMWAVSSAQSVTALRYDASSSDRLYLVMPLAWEKSLAGALESLLPEPITAYAKAILRAEESSAGYLNLTLQSVTHRERGIQTVNQIIKGM